MSTLAGTLGTLSAQDVASLVLNLSRWAAWLLITGVELALPLSLLYACRALEVLLYASTSMAAYWSAWMTAVVLPCWCIPVGSCSAMCFGLRGAGNCHYSSLNGWDVSWTSEAGPVTFKCARLSAAGGIRNRLQQLLIQCRPTASPPSAAAQSGQAPLQSSRAAREVIQSTMLPSGGCVESSRAD